MTDWKDQLNNTAKPVKKNQNRNGVAETTEATQALTLRTTASAINGVSSALENLALDRNAAVETAAQVFAALTSEELFKGDVLRRASEIRSESEPETKSTSFFGEKSFFEVSNLETLMPECLRIAGNNSLETLTLRSAEENL